MRLTSDGVDYSVSTSSSRIPRPARRLVRACSIRRRKRGSCSRRYSNQSSSNSKPISTPAGLPWRVMTISCVSASRRNRDRSSLISDSGTSLIPESANCSSHGSASDLVTIAKTSTVVPETSSKTRTSPTRSRGAWRPSHRRKHATQSAPTTFAAPGRKHLEGKLWEIAVDRPRRNCPCALRHSDWAEGHHSSGVREKDAENTAR